MVIWALHELFQSKLTVQFCDLNNGLILTYLCIRNPWTKSVWIICHGLLCYCLALDLTVIVTPVDGNPISKQLSMGKHDLFEILVNMILKSNPVIRTRREI